MSRHSSTPALALAVSNSPKLIVRCFSTRDQRGPRTERLSAAALAGLQLEARASLPPINTKQPVRTTVSEQSPAAPTNGASVPASQQAQPEPLAVLDTSMQEANDVGASASQRAPTPQPPSPTVLRADDAWKEFEARFEADLKTVAVTLVAIVGIICFWRGIWSLLDYYLGDNPIGDVSCVLVGFGIIAYIRLSGLKVGSFWPSG